LIAGRARQLEVIRSQEEEATVEALFEGLPAEIEISSVPPASKRTASW